MASLNTIKHDTVIPRTVVNHHEWSLLNSLTPEQLDVLNNIVLKMCKHENEKCAEVVRSHQRFYTKSIEAVEEEILERYK
jgi:hypothetical protein